MLAQCGAVGIEIEQQTLRDVPSQEPRHDLAGRESMATTARVESCAMVTLQPREQRSFVTVEAKEEICYRKHHEVCSTEGARGTPLQ